ncbi:hypothetical protein KJY73_05660 [Bowmanella sp. Y26]|uniref:Uncharacterized protein n=1 Tax=Bowmanella yangjiangensis TaxID=2811230 RepID=A0ABS3CRW1_9ALTE|nr:hypothetical protein [Bowmanella yangjiangensis]MBN7819025.1 hypothetical protein [Bowmanella yangjiangensis]MBT1063052.1 hypothetical protein [Bowmanella yangjiangensis]
MLLAILVSVISAVFYYVEAFRTGLCAKHWGLAGLLFGPLVFPLFSVRKQMALRKVRGFGSVYLRA